MEKLASVAIPIHEPLQRRWSARAFADREVEPAVLHALFEAARWAPSSGNEQPWRFLVARRSERADFERVAALLTPGNQRWAPQAAALTLSLARTAFTRTGAPNRYAWHDTGLALANLMIEATARGLIAHPMAGFDAAAARSTLAIPAEFDPVAMIAIGYPGDPATLPEDLQTRELAPRQRRPIEETVFAPAWGQPAPFLSA